MFRQFVSARTHCATTCLLAYVCVFICMQSIKSNQNQIKYFDSKKPSGIRYQLLVPAGLRKRVLEETHDGLCGGHLGEEKTFQKLKLSHYWPGYWNSVRDWCRTCAACASRKTPAPKNKA